MALTLSLWAGVLALLGGSPEMKSRHGLPVHVGRIIALYMISGPILGAFIGLLYPLMRFRWLAILVATVACVPWAFAIGFTVEGALPTDRNGLLTVAVMSIAFGVWGGIVFYHYAAKRRSHSPVGANDDA